MLSGWFPRFLNQIAPWLEPRYPALWLQLLAIKYAITTGKPRSPNQLANVNQGETMQKSEAGILN